MTATQPKALQLEQDEKQYAGQSLLQLAMRRLRRDKLTLLAISFLVVVTVLSASAPFIAKYLIHRDYQRTDLPNIFVPPGGQERLLTRVDSTPFSTSTLYVSVLIGLQKGEPGTTINDLPLAVPLSTLTAATEKGVVYFVHGAPLTPADRPVVDLYLNNDTKPAVEKLRYERISDALNLAPGTYDIAVRANGAAPDSAPIAQAKGVNISAKTLTAIVLMGKGTSTGDQAPRVQAYSVDMSGLDTTSKVRNLYIDAISDVATARLLVDNKSVYENLTYKTSAIVDGDPGVHVVSAADVNAPTFVLGSDDLGRDQLARLLYGGQVSLTIAFTAALISIFIGVSLGIITGFYGGVTDDFVNWVITTLNSIPTLILLLIIVAVMRPTSWTLILVLGFLGWTGTTRLVRGETLSIRAREYIVSARSIGAPTSRIMLVHILPNLLSIVLITLALDIGGLILTEAALSFLGFGVDPSMASWGNMLTNAQNFFTLGPHLVIYPGLLISITVLCLYVIGDGLRDAFDPTLKS